VLHREKNDLMPKQMELRQLPLGLDGLRIMNGISIRLPCPLNSFCH
jgi:hypothetical protein